ncbi:unnamed protein product [Acanthoscelides obtectus]|uniref:Uncharacterized protein n=1 Tax=Acanthoscelides obtectus TaxID=200917 RepID=A0A9P0KAP6_ACAOB|nr:unnamed protein product [Acanthoscelides obtectus]CAK1672677.1 hypothetical protein AOBTE_LOCUS29036 [Acanthoscelides obtectus]
MKFQKNTIENCFQHGGLVKSIDEFDSDDYLPLNQWYVKYKSVDDDWNVPLRDWLRTHCPHKTTVDKYLSELDNFTIIDDNLVATETLTDCDIIAEVVESNHSTNDLSSDNESRDVEGQVTEPIPSYSEALCAIKTVTSFLQFTDYGSDDTISQAS